MLFTKVPSTKDVVILKRERDQVFWLKVMRGNHVKKGRVGNTNQMEHTEYSLPGLEQRIDHLHIINL